MDGKTVCTPGKESGDEKGSVTESPNENYGEEGTCKKGYHEKVNC